MVEEVAWGTPVAGTVLALEKAVLWLGYASVVARSEGLEGWQERWLQQSHGDPVLGWAVGEPWPWASGTPLVNPIAKGRSLFTVSFPRQLGERAAGGPVWFPLLMEGSAQRLQKAVSY